MPQPHKTLVIAAPVDEVWAVMRRFDGLAEWHPAIATSALDSGDEDVVGAVRRLTTPDGATIVERLVALDDSEHRLAYEIVEGPFPVTDYVSTMQATADGDGTLAEWSAQFHCDPAVEDEMVAVFGDGVFGAGLAALAARVGR